MSWRKFTPCSIRVEAALEKMSERIRAGYAIDFQVRIVSLLQSPLPIRVQDLISRFTLDSATEFLFGACVHSLRSTLPFPHNVSASSPFASAALTPPAEKVLDEAEGFASAFLKAEHLCAERATQGKLWPLWEMREDKSRQYMRIVDAYLHPILEEALAKKARREREETAKRVEEAVEIEEEETLLDHLVKFTSGKQAW